MPKKIDRFRHLQRQNTLPPEGHKAKVLEAITGVSFSGDPSAELGVSTSSSTNTGTSSSADTGTSSSADTGTSSSADTGASSSTNTGASSSTNTGTSSSADTGTSSSADTGASSSTDTGASSSTNTGTSSSTDTGASSSTDTGASAEDPNMHKNAEAVIALAAQRPQEFLEQFVRDLAAKMLVIEDGQVKRFKKRDLYTHTSYYLFHDLEERMDILLDRIGMERSTFMNAALGYFLTMWDQNKS